MDPYKIRIEKYRLHIDDIAERIKQNIRFNAEPHLPTLEAEIGDEDTMDPRWYQRISYSWIQEVENNKDLVKNAIVSGDIEEITRLVERNESYPDGVGIGLAEMLCLAIKYDQIDIANHLFIEMTKGGDCICRVLKESMLHVTRTDSAAVTKFVLLKTFSENTVCPKKSCHFNPMLAAVLGGNLRVLEIVLLSNRAQVNVPMISNQSFGILSGELILQRAVRNGSKQVVDMLVAFGADMDAVDVTKRSALFWAIYQNKLDIVRSLLNNRSSTSTIIHKVGFDFIEELNHSWEVVEMLTDAGCTILVGDFKNVMFSAICDGDVEDVEKLLKYDSMLKMARGCDRSSDTITPLHVAMFRKNSVIAKLFLRCGAKLLHRDGRGETSLEYLISRHKYSTMTMLPVLFPWIEESEKIELLRSGIRKNLPVMVEFLFKHGVFIDDADEFLPLHEASINGYKKCAEVILEFGVDLEVVDSTGRTALDVVKSRGQHDMVQILLNHGANVTINDDEVEEENLPDTTFGRLYVRKVLLKHCIKKKAAKSCSTAISDSSLEYWKNSWSVKYKESFEAFESNCKREVEELKKEKLSESWVSMYDILAASEERLLNFARNDVVEALKSEYLGKYPIYGEMIAGKFKMAKVRSEFYVKCRVTLQDTFESLPIVCIEKIMSYLQTGDIKRIANHN